MRNYKKRMELQAQIKKLEAQRETAREALYRLDDETELPDEEFHARLDSIEEQYNTDCLYDKLLALEYPQSRNQWFKGFFESFGICKSRRITAKQADVFKRYSEAQHERSHGRGLHYYVRVNNLFADTHDFGDCAYLTIIQLI